MEHVFDTIQNGIAWFCLNGWGYQFWSGIGSGSPILAGALLAARKHNCHVKGCWSVITHPDPAVHAPACSRHHSHAHLRGYVHER